MTITLSYPAPKLTQLPTNLPLEGAVSIDIEQGIPIFRASRVIQERIETLLHKQRTATLTEIDKQELTRFEEIDDYLSFINRLTRNLITSQP